MSSRGFTPFREAVRPAFRPYRLFSAALLVAVVLVAILGIVSVSFAASKTFTVNTADDLDDGSCNPQHCSLREAMNQANTNGGPDFIHFDIDGTAPYTISVTAALPPVTEAVTIDGTSEPDFAGSPIIVLDGSGAPVGEPGINLKAGSTTIQGLVIHSFRPNGILIQFVGGNVIQGNFIGTDASGTVVKGNSGAGIMIDRTSGNVIGGITTAERNIISGNQGSGVFVQGASATNNLILGNYLGTDVHGTAALPNEGAGIYIDNAPYTTVGGTVPGARNTISGNDTSGVVIKGAVSAENVVMGNYIGTDSSGTAAVANTRAGVSIDDAPKNIIGGTTAGARNVISGNGQDGVQIVGPHATGNKIQGNYIGSNAAGTAALGNRKAGIFVDQVSQQIIGGAVAGASNLISGNDTYGVYIRGSSAISNTIQGNYIGTNLSGTLAVGNLDSGVRFEGAPNNNVGGTTVIERNLISSNGGSGIEIDGATASGNLIRGNYIGTDLNGAADLGNLKAGVSIVGAPANTIGGLVATERNLISGNTYSGVLIEGDGSTGNQVQGNYIGTDANGTADLGNSQSGVHIDQAAGNTVGGTDTGARNLISGNDYDGVRITGMTASNNQIWGNFIGTNFDGSAAIGNVQNGIRVTAAVHNTIGGPSLAARNLISGNGAAGVHLEGTSNIVQGNYIGTSHDGTASLGNADTGVLVYYAANNIIGGTDTGAGNLVSGNGADGVGIKGASATGNLVQGNYIGTNAGGSAAIANGGAGVNITSAPDNTIGGTTSNARNLISGNSDDGVFIEGVSASGNLVQGNRVGTNATGDASLANASDGIEILDAPNNTIGGSSIGEGNLISGNGDDGVRVGGSATGNLVQGNYVGTDASGTSALGNSAQGVSILGPANTVGGTGNSAGNLISGNIRDGVLVTGTLATANVIEGNYIGTNATGDAALPNGESGVRILDAHGNSIGGPEAGAANLLSGNLWYGLHISGAPATGNLVQGNHIGTSLPGDAPVPNQKAGIFIQEAPSNTIGGSATGEGNLISGNSEAGVAISGSGATGNQIQGNWIGTKVNGNEALANGQAGVYISGSPGNTVGGTTTGSGNLISGNASQGVAVYGTESSANLVQGNRIGTTAAGDDALPNSQNGVWIAQGAHSNTVGGTASGSGNLISANGQSGVYLEDSTTMTNTIQGNFIGTKANLVDGLGNSGAGVYVQGAVNNTIGGEAPGAANLIAFNGGDGVTIYHHTIIPDEVLGPGVTTTTTGNQVRINSIFANGGLGIDLGPDDGVTANDPQDPDSGANLLQNHPVLGAATTGYNMNITGTLNSLLTTTFTLDFYNSEACDPSGYGEGATYLGSITATTNISGNASFDIIIPTTVPVSSVVTSVATDPDGNTSEFSECEVVRALYKVYMPVILRNFP